jgi:hypothetical protein
MEHKILPKKSQPVKQQHSDFFGKKKDNPFFSPVFIQPKLTIGPADDPYEREADLVADKVMRMSNTETLQTKISPVGIQRKCAACEEEDKKVQMKGEGSSAGSTNAPSSVSNVINSGGQPLDAGTRGFMESRFGYDFGNVQIHNDSHAHQSSADINALAYTNGNHIAFGAGQYQPNTISGRQLLAHELVHVVQQNSNTIQTKKVQRALGKYAKCPANADGSPADPMKEILQANEKAAHYSLGSSHLLFSDSLFMQDPSLGPSSTLKFYRKRFGDPVVVKGKFKNRFNGTKHSTLLLAQASEMQVLSDRMKTVSDYLNTGIHFQCPGTKSIKLGNCASSKCNTALLMTCPTKSHGKEVAVCPAFWGKGVEERAIGIIHEMFHLLFRFGDRDTAPYADTAAKRGKEPECYTSLAADIYGVAPFDPSCPNLP